MPKTLRILCVTVLAILIGCGTQGEATVSTAAHNVPKVDPISATTSTTTTTTTLPVSTTTTHPPRTTTTTSGYVGSAATDYSSMEPCGGDLPPCRVKYRESRGDYSAYNPTGCKATIQRNDGSSVTGQGCYGAWQLGWFWAGTHGLPDDLSQATPSQQDTAARELWNGGKGCGNWAAC